MVTRQQLDEWLKDVTTARITLERAVMALEDGDRAHTFDVGAALAMLDRTRDGLREELKAQPYEPNDVVRMVSALLPKAEVKALPGGGRRYEWTMEVEQDGRARRRDDG